jgi:hypothetical protein
VTKKKLQVGDHVELRGNLTGHSGTITKLGKLGNVIVRLDPGQTAMLGRTVINVDRWKIARQEGAK